MDFAPAAAFFAAASLSSWPITAADRMKSKALSKAAQIAFSTSGGVPPKM
jgi:hypothetical protein